MTYDFLKRADSAIEKSINKPEEQLKIEFESELKNYFNYLELDIEGQYEQHPGNNLRIISKKRQDATYGKVVIEYEAVGRLLTKAGKKHALDQLKVDYLSKYSEDERRDMVGIAFDGRKIIFVRWVNGQYHEDERDYSEHNLEVMVNYIKGLFRTSLKELPNKFGFHRTITRNTINVLYDKSFSNNKRVKMLFNEWNLRYSSIYGNAFNQDKIKSHLKEIQKEIGIKNLEGNRLVFVLHTFYAMIVKVIASEVAQTFFNGQSKSNIKALIDGNLKDLLKEIEEGKFFTDVGIENFIEGTFLSWYIDAWENDIEKTLIDVIKELDSFDFSEFTTRPEQVVDYLKLFYEGVFPKELRHDLGEFYTPDWLANYIVTETNFDGDVSQRLLDPACGSGTFLISILNKIYNKYEKIQKKDELLKKITRNVVGFDINPVAVLTARTNYLISLSRFNFQKTVITIPVYLTDSIVLPEVEKQDVLNRKSHLYQIKTTKGIFKIPRDIKPMIIQIMQSLKESIENNQDVGDVGLELKKRFNLDENIIHHLIELYEKIYKLNKQNENRIWFDIIINQFATLFQEKFDFVIGNPPWVNWEFLSDEYQNNLIKLNDQYGLYLTKGLESRLGKIRRDISAIFFYVCADVYLKENGIIAFLIKPMYQMPSGVGFRNFNRIMNVYSENRKPTKLTVPIKISLVENLTEENPFEINNEVSLIFGTKGLETKYPITYEKWTGKRTHELEKYKAEPSDENSLLSTWIIYKGKKPEKVLGEFNYPVRTGVYFGLKSALFDLEIIMDKGNLAQIKNFEGKIKDIEKDRLYPLIKSRHLDKWKIGSIDGEKYTYCILPQDRLGENNEQQMKTNYPKTYEWLRDFRSSFLKRKSKMFTKEPFYSIFGLGDWKSPYKVVWNSMGKDPSFVVISYANDKTLGKRLILPEHVLQFIPLTNKQEAYYVCAILNSSTINQVIKTISSGSKSGLTKNIIEKIRLDKFNPKIKGHKRLVILSKTAHNLAKNNKEDKLKEIENEIDSTVKKLYKKEQVKKRPNGNGKLA